MSWSKDLDFPETYRRLEFALTTKAKEHKRYHKPARRSKIAILLIALRNGARCSEAMDAFNQFVINKNPEQTVRVRKRGYAYVRVQSFPAPGLRGFFEFLRGAAYTTPRLVGLRQGSRSLV